jgi:inner membrane transporter RhtA
MPMTRGRFAVPGLLAGSAVFHYLGPALAVLLFARIDVLGVAWLRIAAAAALFAVWRRPWASTPLSRELVAFAVVLAAMNTVFYLAIARLPLATVGAIEFLGVIVLAAGGARSRRNTVALALAVAGVLLLTDVRLAGEPVGFAFAFANCALFMLYVTVGHRVAGTGAGGADRLGGVDRLGLAMLVAMVLAAPVGLAAAVPAFGHPWLLLAAVGVGVCSSVIPYVTDQLAMARLSRSSFALMLSVLPAMATVIGLVVLDQLPTVRDLGGIALVIAAVALHRPGA